MTTLRYDDLGSVNAVKILPKIDSYNGFIQLYTEIDSHIEEGDNVFLTFTGDIVDSLNLDNSIYIDQEIDSYYSKYATGYNIIHVNKNINSFVIERKIFDIPQGIKPYDYYVSKISAQKLHISHMSIDSAIITTSDSIIDSCEWKQGVVFDADIINTTLINKYESNYISLNLIYNETTDTYTKINTLNNNLYGYSYFINSNNSITNSNIENGWFYNCRIKTQSNNIDNGYFDECKIEQAIINNGHYKNSTIDDDSEWNYGKWENSQNPFVIETWNDGIFLTGVFGDVDINNVSLGDSIWKNGYFIDGDFKGRLWENGKFQGGTFWGVTWDEGSGSESHKKTALFAGGFFNGGEMKPINNLYSPIVHDITINGGEIHNSILSNINLEYGKIIDSNIKFSELNGGEIINSNIILSNQNNSKIINSEFSDTKVLNGEIIDSTFYHKNIIKNGTIENSTIANDIIIYNGTFKSNIFKIINKSGLSGSISQKILKDGSNFVKKIYVEFINGHSFRPGDDLELNGFDDVELNNQILTIPPYNQYEDPTKYSGGSFAYFNSTGDTYVILEGIWRNHYQGAKGYLSGISHSVDSNDKIIIENGEFLLDDFDNVIINNGNFVNTNMHNGTIFNNGDFRGGYFSSILGIENENIWNNGNFYDGKFGARLSGSSEAYMSISDTKMEIFEDTIIENLNIKIVNIYPAQINSQINSLGSGVLSVGPSLSDIRPFNESDVMDSVPWSATTSTSSNNLTFSPYRLIVKIDCTDTENKGILKYRLDHLIDGLNVNIVDLAFKENNPNSSFEDIYSTFNDLYSNGSNESEYTMDSYQYIQYYIKNTNDTYIYLLFESEHVKNLYNDANSQEKTAFDLNFKNAWSITNSGYFTNPLPVLDNGLAGGTDNINNLDYFKIKENTNSPYSDEDWICGSNVPPWWLENTHTGTAQNIDRTNKYSVNWKHSPISINDLSYINTNNNVEIFVSGGTNPDYTQTTISEDVINHHSSFHNLLNMNLQIPFMNTFTSWIKYHFLNKFSIGEKHSTDLYVSPLTDLEVITSAATSYGWTGWTSVYNGNVLSAAPPPNTYKFSNNDEELYINIDNDSAINRTTSQDYYAQFQIQFEGKISFNLKSTLNIQGGQGVSALPVLTPTPDYSQIFESANMTTVTVKTLLRYSYKYISISNLIASGSKVYSVKYSRKHTLAEIESVCPECVIPSTGLSWYGIPTDSQNLIYDDDRMVEEDDSIFHLNEYDTNMFESYWRYRRGQTNTFFEGFSYNPILDNYYNDEEIDEDDDEDDNFETNGMYAYNSSYFDWFSTREFTNEEKSNFELWNSKISTTSRYFNRKAGVQLKADNRNVSSSSYRDKFYDGVFYSGDFQGVWEGGKWVNGYFHGWNNLVPAGSSESLTAPYETNPNTKISVVKIHKDDKLLISNKKYYEVAPWDQSRDNIRLN